MIKIVLITFAFIIFFFFCEIYRYEAKSYTPDSMGGNSGGRASAESPDAMKQQMHLNSQQQNPQTSAEAVAASSMHQPQQPHMGFNR